MTILAAVLDLQDKANQLGDVREAPDYPPESANQFPFVLCYPDTGTVELQSQGWAKFFHTLVVELHCSRQSIKTAIDQILSFVENFPDKLIDDPTLSSSVSETVSIDYTFAAMRYNDIDTIGVRFRIQVKLHSV